MEEEQGTTEAPGISSTGVTAPSRALGSGGESKLHPPGLVGDGAVFKPLCFL